MYRSFELLDVEYTVEFDAKVTFPGCAETGPSHASGGEPAAPMEWELTGDIVLRQLVWANERDCTWAERNGLAAIPPVYVESEPLEIPGWLHDEIVKWLEADDDGSIEAELEEDGGPDPDIERERYADDRD